MSDAFNLIVLAPILEELVFRLPLRRFFRNIFFSAALLVYAFSKTYIGIPLAIVAALAFATLPYIPKLINKYEKEVDTFIEKHYPYFFYFVALIFGFRVQ